MSLEQLVQQREDARLLRAQLSEISAARRRQFGNVIRDVALVRTSEEAHDIDTNNLIDVLFMVRDLLQRENTITSQQIRTVRQVNLKVREEKEAQKPTETPPSEPWIPIPGVLFDITNVNTLEGTGDAFGSIDIPSGISAEVD